MSKQLHTVGAGLRNLITNSPPKTERLLSLFLFAVIALMSVSMYFVLTSSLKKDLTALHVSTSAQKSQNIVKEIERYLETHRLQLVDLSNSPILKQFIMNPDQNSGLFRDYLSQETILGNRYAQVVYNYRGAKVFSTDAIDLTHQDILKRIGVLKPSIGSDEYQYDNQFQNYKDIYQKKITHLVRISAQGDYWEIALPVHYGNTIEGIIVTYIPISKLSTELELDALIGISVKIDSFDRHVIWGNRNVSQWIKTSSSNRHVRFAYAIDTSMIDESFSLAKLRLLVSLGIIAVISTLLAFIFGRWFFVKPLENLRAFAEELSEGADPHLTRTKRMTDEIQALSDQICDMAIKIRRREEALKQSNEELKNNQDTLVHSEKMAGLGQVTAGVAHEVNNPIGFIMNNLTMLQEYHAFLKVLLSQLHSLKLEVEQSSWEGNEALLKQINDTLKQEDLDFVLNDLDCVTNESVAGAERVKEITQALKGYAYSGEKASLVDVNECIEATLKMVWNELKYHCRVEKVLNNTPQIECMGGQINQVLMNLFINAAHAMKDRNGVLYIESGLDDQYVYILIRDNGCGIDDENLNHIFEPFFTTKAVGEGTGLGMSICYDIIKKHGGTINVSSEVGVGTEFMIRLPLSQSWVA